MDNKKLWLLLFALSAGSASLGASAVMAAEPGAAAPTSAHQLAPEELQTLVRDVYQYAYPLVLMDITMRQATNVADATSHPQRAPLNQFAQFRSHPAAGDRDVVRFNFDTLYSLAWLDVGKEPVVLSLPDGKGRYYLAPLLDMWTDVFAVPGSRTTGGKAGNFAIAAPSWQGELPDGVELIRAPTPMVWAILRTQTNGPADYAAVHKMQDQYRLTPLSQWGKDYAPPRGLPVDPQVDNLTPPQQQINQMSGIELFTRFAELLKQYPPHANDYPILFRMKRLGLVPGQAFDVKGLDKATVAAINDGARKGLLDMQDVVATGAIGKRVNGWNWFEGLGTYGTSYRARATVAMAGLGANLPEDAIYPNAYVDAEGRPFSGEHAYVLRFEKGQLPPVDAFWSLTMYDEQGFQVANPIDRFAIGDRDDLRFEPDGALEILIQHRTPEQSRQGNWLPAPAGNFQVTMRLFSPQWAARTGAWVPPAIRRVE
ncbi:DUF1254 domain-containing protein [Zestomonas carbonaria]|uniref:DUF1254 domain-containing protein n=1 Tax=Zestomonas carbonaria TaxID=2762745 RepID=A0A7U7IAZ0_9GAMM|nr:DUF1254 domain-containing protein [Pseudomonas carbonaria]CAD5109944.1 hypothetical protein PSEWESI4_04260 [Pseudomonas carbonaria]